MTGLAVCGGSAVRGLDIRLPDVHYLQRHGADGYALPHRIDHSANMRSLAEAGWVVSAEEACSAPAAGRRNDAILGKGAVAVVRRDRCPATLAVRNRRPGDRFRPPGVGRKKLQDFFVDLKVARRDRDAVPLVVDELDRIVWVAGYAIDGDFRVTSPVEAVVILRLKVLGGLA